MTTEKLFQVAERAREASRFKEALRRYRTILKGRRTSLLDRVEAMLGAADVCRLQGRFRDSIAFYRKARSLLHRIDSPRAVDAETGLALALRAVGRPREALSLLTKAFRHYRADGDPDGVAFSRWALGGTYRIAGDLRRGWKELKASESLYRRLRDDEGLSYTFCALGGLARMRCDLDASSRYYRRANALMRKRKDVFGMAYSYCGIGNVHRMREDFKTALRYFKKAERLYKRIGDRVSYAYTLWSIGTTYKMLGRFSMAKAAFSAADKLFRATGDTRGQVYTLLGTAELSLLRGHSGKAGRLIARAGVLCRKGRFAWEALHVKALRDPAAARRLYRRAGSRFKPSRLPFNTS